MGGGEICRTRIRLMMLIPAVILPAVIIIIALSKSTVIGKSSMRSTHSVQEQITANSIDLTTVGTDEVQDSIRE